MNRTALVRKLAIAPIFRAVLVAGLILPVLARAGLCAVPPFEPFAPVGATPVESPSADIDYRMQPVARLKIPKGFARLVAFPYGTVVFGDHPDGIKAVLGFETAETIKVYDDRRSPADFILSIFEGSSAAGCRYLEAQKLGDEAYRLHRELAPGMEIFAYGTGTTHHFYMVRKDRPDTVVRGEFKNMERAQFETILATITAD